MAAQPQEQGGYSRNDGLEFHDHKAIPRRSNRWANSPGCLDRGYSAANAGEAMSLPLYWGTPRSIIDHPIKVERIECVNNNLGAPATSTWPLTFSELEVIWNLYLNAPLEFGPLRRAVILGHAKYILDWADK